MEVCVLGSCFYGRLGGVMEEGVDFWFLLKWDSAQPIEEDILIFIESASSTNIFKNY